MKNRLAELQKNIPADMGAALITSPVNRSYYLRFSSSAGTVVVTKQKSYLIIDSRYFERAREMVKNCTVILQDKLDAQISEILKQHKVKALGLESSTVTVSELLRYQKAFEGVEILTDNRISDAISKQRSIKSAEEVDCMRAAQNIADAAFLHILNFIEVGKTEIEVAVELEIFCRRNGAEGQSFPTIVASGRNSSHPHAVPTDKPIQTGDFVTMDYGCKVGGYCSDMTRTVAMGAVHPRQREAYEMVLAAQLESLKVIKAGVPCVEVDAVARKIIDASEFKGSFGHSLGHSLGLDVHEDPRCSHLSKDILEAGMLTSVEPGIYLPGEFGLRIEDVVLVTQGGYENLCASPKELIIL